MTDLEQVKCSKCDATYHREIEPDTFFFSNVCDDCKPKPTVFAHVTYSDFRIIEKAEQYGMELVAPPTTK